MINFRCFFPRNEQGNLWQRACKNIQKSDFRNDHSELECSRYSLRIQHNSRVIINRLQRRPWAGFIAGLCIKQQSGNKLTAMIAEWSDKVVY